MSAGLQPAGRWSRDIMKFEEVKFWKTVITGGIQGRGTDVREWGSSGRSTQNYGKLERDFGAEIIDVRHFLMNGVAALVFTRNIVNCEIQYLVIYCAQNH